MIIWKWKIAAFVIYIKQYKVAEKNIPKTFKWMMR